MQLDQLIALAELYDHKKQTKQTPALPGLFVMRKTKPDEIEAVVYDPVLCLILRGGKETSIGVQSISLRAGDALLVSHDLPVISKITHATPQAPYLALVLSLDLSVIRGLYEQVGAVVADTPSAQSLTKSAAEPAWVDPLSRYLALMDDPLEAKVIGPLILREIHFRLLMSPIGAMLRNLLSVDSHASRIAQSILRIREGFRSHLAITELAKLAGMSTSSFHEHFKSVTGTTPLQYQKDLRMFEARRLLLGRTHSVSAAAFEVGYDSPTQFSREYTRRFGHPPSKDIGRALAAE